MLSRFFSLGMKMKKEVEKVMIGCCVKFSEKFCGTAGIDCWGTDFGTCCDFYVHVSWVCKCNMLRGVLTCLGCFTSQEVPFKLFGTNCVEVVLLLCLFLLGAFVSFRGELDGWMDGWMEWMDGWMDILSLLGYDE